MRLLLLAGICIAGLPGCADEATSTQGAAPIAVESAQVPAPRQPSAASTDQAPATRSIRACRSADGAISYQEKPCAADAAELALREVESEKPGTVQRSAQIQADAIADARRVAEIAYGSNRARSGTRRAANEFDDAICEDARRSAKAVRDEYWKRMTYEWSQQLDAWVHVQCAGTNRTTRYNTMPMGPARNAG